MKNFELIITTEFGLESIVKRECEELNFDNVQVSNGKVTFTGTIEDIARANIYIRCGERVLIKISEFKALEFEDIFQGVKNSEIMNYLPVDGDFIVNARSKNSKLSSVPAIQSVGKKAIMDRLKERYSIDWFDEDGPKFEFELSLDKDICTFTLDTTGEGLHKRGYRKIGSKAPLRETLASALINLSFWNKKRPLIDPFCGSGTILIEAAMIARNIAPGLMRDFQCMEWGFIGVEIFEKIRDEAYEKIDYDTELDLTGFDIDGDMIRLARDNAKKLGLQNDIDFIHMDMKSMKLKNNYGVLITNPPYGKRLLDKKEASSLEKTLGSIMSDLNTWSVYVITSSEDFEKNYGRKADRKRKLYNGRIETQYYQFYGPNPSKRG